MSTDATDLDVAFESSLRRSMHTVQTWDDDPTLLKECRLLIPPDIFEEDVSSYGGSCNEMRLRHLCRWFRASMTWVNHPICSTCQSSDHQTLVHVRGPAHDHEIQGQALRVEVYQCQTCSSETTFPRYNHPRTLLRERQGRCGEYANLFGLTCRSLGLHTRYVTDWSDHVWIEVYCAGRWIMMDGCEGVVDECSMYEHGWGKRSPTMIIATANDHMVDVTPRYTRMRSRITTNEVATRRVIQSLNGELQRRLSVKDREILQTRLAVERNLLDECQKLTTWDKVYEEGRLSGSMAWKMQRYEAGANGDQQQSTHTLDRLFVECYCPTRAPLNLRVHPVDGILVHGGRASMQVPHHLSMVVVHENTVVRSRSVDSLASLADLVDSVPKFRIVLVHGALEGEVVAGEPTTVTSEIQQKLHRLVGFDSKLIKNGVLYVGQLEASPSWTQCATFNERPQGITIQATKSLARSDMVTVDYPHARPRKVSSRVADSVLSGPTQRVASRKQKVAAFQSTGGEVYSGMTTKEELPVYLVDAGGFPLVHDEMEQWTTTVFVPKELGKKSGGSGCPQYQVPLDTELFVGLLGTHLLRKKDDGATERVPTAGALSNARLVGLYFSAHWCGPCRSFTPMLATMYEHLKEVKPSHGLEIIFYSSDRDANSFDKYYGSMPWCAIPFDSLSSVKHMASMKYQVRGIPSLVVLDAVSGEIVVGISESRGHVSNACQHGETAVEDMMNTWMEMIPQETKEMIELLELSCQDEKQTEDANPYLCRIDDVRRPKDQGKRIKEFSADLIEEGLSPNMAATKATELVTNDQYPPGPLDKVFVVMDTPVLLEPPGLSSTDTRIVVETALKYVENASNSPFNPKFRSFKLSNKVVDRIIKQPAGIALMEALGFDIEISESDFVFAVPLGVDFNNLRGKLDELLAHADS